MPFFNADVCTLEATDVVVVTPASKKGEFQVVETIKGDLPSGAPVLLNELYLSDDVSAGPPPMQTGDRVIVFLLRPGAQFVSGIRANPSQSNDWRSANIFGDMRFSAAWLRNGEVFAFIPLGDHAEVELQNLGVSEPGIPAANQERRSTPRVFRSGNGLAGGFHGPCATACGDCAFRR